MTLNAKLRMMMALNAEMVALNTKWEMNDGFERQTENEQWL